MGAARQREFDIVVWGATGFTGALVLAYLAQQYGVAKDLRWAAAARNPDKLKSVCAAVARDSGVAAVSKLPQLQANSDDLDSLRALARRSRVIISTVGPYALYGSKLVQACAEEGTDYCDLAGEIQWLRQMIDAWGDRAKASGARIVHCCGFDSVPFDMGVWYVQREMQRRHGVSGSHVIGTVRKFKGASSGGTVASILNLMEEAARDPSIRRLMRNPYSLLPATEQSRTHPPAGGSIQRIPELNTWTAPFIMSAVNIRIVYRSNALLGYPWGEDFRYDESMGTGAGAKGHLRATVATAGLGMFMVASALKPSRALLRMVLPEPGEGPDAAARRAGHYRIQFLAKHPTDASKDVIATVDGDMDPGYGSTAKMLSECALCLAKDGVAAPGGSWTPASVMGEPLLTRLNANAGLQFAVED